MEHDGCNLSWSDSVDFVHDNYCQGIGKHGPLATRIRTTCVRSFNRGGHFSYRDDGDAYKFRHHGGNKLGRRGAESAEVGRILCGGGGRGVLAGARVGPVGESDADGRGSSHYGFGIDLCRSHSCRTVRIQRRVGGLSDWGGFGGGERGESNRKVGGARAGPF